MDIRFFVDAPAAGQAKLQRLVTEAVAQWAGETYGLDASNLNVTFDPVPAPTADPDVEADPDQVPDEVPDAQQPPAAPIDSKKKKIKTTP